MFSGIVHAIGRVTKIEKKQAEAMVVIEASTIARQVKLGSSVSVDGVCLTVEKKSGTTLQFSVMGETLRKTVLADKVAGDTVNVESSLRVGDEIAGHFVYGHVDGIAEVKKVSSHGDSVLLTIALPKKLQKYVAPQGSIAIDGVSLTVAKLGKQECTVSLVDYTLKHTTLGGLKKGDRVNIECDMLAKYVQRH